MFIEVNTIVKLQKSGGGDMVNQINVNWGGNEIILKWFPKKVLSNNEVITSVHSYCFDQNKVLLVQVKDRGFNIPGGHLESGETPEEALHREVYEEAYVKGNNIEYLGAIEVNHTNNRNFNPNGPYPLIGYQLFYRMDIAQCYPFLRGNETQSRIWVEQEIVPFVLNDHQLLHLILKQALNVNVMK